ncbi:hypothetical protein [Nocardia asiatica]|uniref:hypothetical protein n=1 Tax=Nocardia asiatica TaxID=209252 RepID=UPI0012FB9E14|nr:hypothetical protein [Nocardia asiatica]
MTAVTCDPDQNRDHPAGRADSRPSPRRRPIRRAAINVIATALETGGKMLSSYGRDDLAAACFGAAFGLRAIGVLDDLHDER